MVHYSSPSRQTWAQRRYAPEPVPARPPGRPLIIILGAAMSAFAGVYAAQLMPAPTLSSGTKSEPMVRPPRPAEGLRIVVTAEPTDTMPPVSLSTEAPHGALTFAMTEQAPVATRIVNAVAIGFHPPYPAAPACEANVSLAAEMACVDPLLALAEQRLSKAYVEAVEAGAERLELGRDQARWLLVREAAARASPEALAKVYQMREQRLIALAAALTENPDS